MPDMRAQRDALIARLQAAGTIRSPRVADAMRAVERERFIPGADPRRAYEDEAIAIVEREGIVISSISQPSIVAHMLELLDVRDGSRVLEIGTGSGYNAALLATLAGERGSVTSVEIEPELLLRAREALPTDGFAHVRLLHDRELATQSARYDRTIVTARAHDIDARWWERLEDAGCLVVPLDIGYGGERVIAFERHGMRLVSDGSCACAFVALRGVNDAPPEIFFRSPLERFRGTPGAHRALEITAIERVNAEPSFLEEGDAVVAREHTLFALRRA